jgi:hypothetical protein
VNDEQLIWLLLGSKPLIYGWLLVIPRFWLPPSERPSRWVPVLGAGIRTLLGLIVALPLAFFGFLAGSGFFIVLLSVGRIASWYLTALLCYPTIPGRRLLAFSVACTALNWIFDVTLFTSFRGHGHFISF